MSKLAMEIFSGPNPSVATLRAKVSETENSHWYNAGRHQGKFTGARCTSYSLRGDKHIKQITLGERLLGAVLKMREAWTPGRMVSK